MPPDSALLRDEAARTTALTAIGRTLLVQAGAGSGKTSVLAGRVVVLLAEGVPPSAIAAISFTEFSASELRERIVRFVDAVLSDRIPPDLAAGFPKEGPTAAQLDNLRRASEDLDLLSCQTIHGFCRTLLTPYPVEAGIDPGAAMLDDATANLLFEDTYRAFLRRRLSGKRAPDDSFAALYAAEPGRTDDILRKLAEAMLEHRGADVADVADGVGAVEELAALRRAVATLGEFVTQQGADRCPADVGSAAAALAAQIAEVPEEEALSLVWLAQLAPPDGWAVVSTGEFRKRVCTKTAWKAILGGGKATQPTIDRLNDLASRLYDDCVSAHEAVRVAAAGHILRVVADQARRVAAAYEAAKRASAALDFEDLLEKTRLLLARRPEVASELARRYRAVLVDEFQDTDLGQLEILWRLCGDPPDGDDDVPWRARRIRPGALFLVGDPKQSIYRFRGADLGAYMEARNLLVSADPECLLEISRNFRSRRVILNWVNERFRACFDVPGQTEFSDLTTDVEDTLELPGVAALHLEVSDANSEGVRLAEADLVAKTCSRLIGNAMVRDRSAPGGQRPCEPRDIALLAPSSTELWLYERALEAEGLTVATQAGKGFFRRQEVQDLIALTRALADDRDRLALGALLRGPLVGFPDETLLDAVAAQPPILSSSGEAFPAQLNLRMDTGLVPDALLRATLEKLASLARWRRRLTPHALLCRAVEEMNVRAILRQRGGRVAERALANVDLFLEMARAYDVRGIRAFADHVRAQWEEAQRSLDARPDADQRSISVVTMHSGKGLEWPVVILINTASFIRETLDVAHDRAENRLHLPVFGAHPPGCRDAIDAEKREQRLERQRLWYVAATRARDLLLIPRSSEPRDRRAWNGLVDLGLQDLQAFGRDLPPEGIFTAAEPPDNTQDSATFDREADAIIAARPRLVRRTPHLGEGAEPSREIAVISEDLASAETRTSRGGAARGMVLHKLMEELLTGETTTDEAALRARAIELLGQVDMPGQGADPGEMAATALRGLGLPGLADIRRKLVPEMAVAFSGTDAGTETVVIGVADALAVEPDGSCSCVVDWKSDVRLGESELTRYHEQLRDYLRATGAPEGRLVFLTSGTIVRIAPTLRPIS